MELEGDAGHPVDHSGELVKRLLSTALLAVSASTGLCICGSFASAATAAPPRVIPRSGWGADESLRFDRTHREIWPRTFWPIQKIIVHHTETQNNDPNPAETIRSIYRDSARLQGLGDIPYNFLIDEQGRIYEGRYSRPYARGETPTGEDQYGNGVTAGHAYGHNAGTVGIALLGSLGRVDATPSARTALERLVAWISGTHQIDPFGSSGYRNPMTGRTTAFPNIAGHRDVNETDCPGQAFYTTLPQVRTDVSALIAGRSLPQSSHPQDARRVPRKPRLTAVERRESRAIDRLLRRHHVVSAGGRAKREVALAFHDGPGPYTTQVLDALRRTRAAATFFDIGDSVIYHSDVVVAERNRAFAVGNLTESYASLTRLSQNKQRREISDQSARLRSLGIPSPRLFSPPFGSYDRRTLEVLRRARMLMVLWSVDTRDYKRPGVQAILRNALHGVRPGSIILLHDGGGDRTQTVRAVPAIVHGLRSRGYKLVTVPRLMLDDPPRP